MGAVSKETQTSNNMLFLLFLIAISVSSNQAEKLLDQCKDVAGRPHKLGDSYIGPDNCNDCMCKEAGNACNKKVCPDSATPRNAEADKCVDKDGILYKKGESYTHVDGCNKCKCTEHGGACSKKLCIKQDVREKMCVDTTGRERTVNDTWLDQCNRCVCGPLGAVCTEKFCGEISGQSGDKPCKDHNDQNRNPGDTWLTEDSCNICSCKGDDTPPTCTKVGCRVRLARLIKADSGSVSFGSAPAMALITLLAIRLLA